MLRRLQIRNQSVEFFVSVRKDINIVFPQQNRIRRLHIIHDQIRIFRSVASDFIRPVFQQKLLIPDDLMDVILQLLFLKHFPLAQIHAEKQVENKTDAGQKEQQKQPRPNALRIPPLKKNNRYGKKHVPEQHTSRRKHHYLPHGTHIIHSKSPPTFFHRIRLPPARFY